ncbi:hypothetical protein EIP91_004181 [Steccherinum ochraceum]|uniref:Major facilitator superfamily (MFS) profile domain-containing protein n=1 Tax=Steccherinum ochraceum TaxID=92696 RepID=A0A4R0RNA7_9APHY|nr:hypothetical protein EIP91_004181 [Steccherinum ochraceum]
MSTAGPDPRILTHADAGEQETEKQIHADELTIHDGSPDASHEKNGASDKEDFDKEDAPVEEVTQAHVDDIPDGGLRAWLVVVGGAFGAFATFGYVNAWGVFQAYYEETVMPTTSPSTIAWIGSVEYALIFVPGLVTGRLFDMGYIKLPVTVASALLITSTFLTAECKEYWQFILCQGILAGVMCGIIFGPMMGVIAHWFKRRRGIALGMIAGGSSIGGTIFPIAARHLIQDVGFKWTMRILGFIQLFALTITCLTVDRRVPPGNISKKFFDLSIFKNRAYCTFCIANLVSFLGLYTVLTYIDVSAVHAGLDPNFTYYLVAIANAASGFGRLGGGYYADRFGPLNIMIPSTTFAAALTYAWPFAKTKADFIVIAIIYGICSGVYVSLLMAPIMSMGNHHNIGIMTGVSQTILAGGALAGPPISGAINASTGGFQSVGYYAGSMVIVAVGFIIATRQLVLKGSIYGKA